MKDLIGKKVFIKYDQGLMLPYMCTIVEVNEELQWFKVQEFNAHWYTLDALLCYSNTEYSNMILFMKRQLDNLIQRNKDSEKQLEKEILEYIKQVNLITDN